MELTSLLNSDSSNNSGIDDASAKKMEDNIRKDSDLGENVAKCFKENKGSLSKVI